MRKELDPGENLAGLERWFEERPDTRRPTPMWFAPFAFLMLSVAGGMILALMAMPLALLAGGGVQTVDEYWDTLPNDLPAISLPQRSHILDANGNLIAEFYSENRVVTTLDKVSPFVVNALVATEDSRFYEHHGVDGEGIVRALRNNASGNDVQGASTITQQLVKNTLLIAATNDEERAAATENTMRRKLLEAHYAAVLETKLSKDEIMNQYLNIVLFSNGVYGIGTAAYYYFGVEASDLTLSQSALLVGLLQNPTGYDPIDHPEAALTRRNIVLERMQTAGYITLTEKIVAKAQPITLDVHKTPNGCTTSAYPFFCQWVVQNLKNDPRLGVDETARANRLHLGGLTITTTLDPAIQDSSQQVLDSTLGNDNRVAAGVAIVEPGTGNVKALVQNRAWGKSDDGVTGSTEIILPDAVSFQPGSSFKPFTLAAALESGFPSDTILYAPTVFNPGNMNVPPGGIHNLASIESGYLSIDKATALSSNTYYATLAQNTGVLNVADMASNLGITIPGNVTSKDASFTLGTLSTSPLEMAAAYAAFASGGLYCAPRGVESITDINGQALEGGDSGCYQAMSRSTAERVTQALTQVIDGPEKWRTGKSASLGRPAGGKTGTTTGHSAAWFVGITPQLSTAVWMGDPRGGFKYPLTGGIRYNGRTVYDVYGSDIAAPLWQSIMSNAMVNMPVEDFSYASIGALTSGSEVPNVQGMTPSAAKGVLEAQGFKVAFNTETAEENAAFVPNVVFSQEATGDNSGFNVDKVTVTLTLTHGSKLPGSA